MRARGGAGSGAMADSHDDVLRVENLCVDFSVKGRQVRILSDISFSLRRGETLGIIGESGCGKSMTALALLRMVPSPPGRITAGRVLLKGEDLVQVSEKRIRGIRGGEISMIFQEPMTSLNPVYTIGNQIAETIRRHKQVGRAAAWKEAVDLLDMVHIPAPERRVHEYPHHLSGGMRQRVMIAMALACEPTVLLADEPTTALDVTVQAQIFDLLKEIQDTHGTCASCLSRMTSARSPRWPIGSWSCTRATRSRRAPSTRSATIPVTRIRADCCGPCRRSWMTRPTFGCACRRSRERSRTCCADWRAVRSRRAARRPCPGVASCPGTRAWATIDP